MSESNVVVCKACNLTHPVKATPWYCLLKEASLLLDRILVLGKPAVGKSHTSGLIFYDPLRITMTPQTGTEMLAGSLQAPEAGKTAHIDGIITVAMRFGKPCIIEEIDRCGPEAESLLYSILDDKPHLNLISGETVKAKSGYKVVMTTNVNPQGVLEEAVVDRFQAFVYADKPHLDAFGELTGNVSLDDALRKISLNWYGVQKTPTIALPPTVRRIRSFAKLYRGGMHPEHASLLTFGIHGNPEIQSVIANVMATWKR